MKYLLVLVVVAVVVWMLTARARGGRPDRGGEGGGPSAPRRGPARGAGAAEMVRCAHCGLHLPQADAVRDGALHFCSDAHRRLGPADGA